MRVERAKGPETTPTRQAALDEAMVSMLSAMRRSPGRYRPLLLKLASAELRNRRTAGAPPTGTLPEAPGVGGAPIVTPVPAEPGRAATARDTAAGKPTSEKQHGVEMSPKRPRQTGAERPSPRRAQRPPLTGEECGSLAAWSTLLALAVIAFFTWSPPRPGRRGAETMVGVVLPADEDPARLSVAALARQPLATIVEVADSRDAAARGRMIAALVRRSAAQELAGLAAHPTAGVRGAVPQGLSSLGLVPPEQVGEYAARLLSPVDGVRDQAARELAGRVGRGREEIARGL
jgi:hypothetical protein